MLNRRSSPPLVPTAALDKWREDLVFPSIKVRSTTSLGNGPNEHLENNHTSTQAQAPKKGAVAAATPCGGKGCKRGGVRVLALLPRAGGGWTLLKKELGLHFCSSCSHLALLSLSVSVGPLWRSAKVQSISGKVWLNANH